MRSRILGLIVLIGVIWAVPASAEAALLEGKLEVEAIAGLGGPLILAFTDLEVDHSTGPFMLYLAGRVRSPQYTPLGLELNAVIPHGFGLNLIIDVLKIGPVRVHLIDPGIFWNAFSPVSCSRVSRSLDLTLGAGVDVRIKDAWSVGLDWRLFLPDPNHVIPVYADFARPIYDEALKGGQLWLRASYTW
ncbi:hypothetical protein AMJ57_01970 [Parcubacteria bacterium SG8_24]|nr:MAG: hypothetical protein AMJ57_01970 [Parcubacteria bacterium SG8_24]